ncbi:phage/plasmid primase, P4 family [Thalassoglobus sp. JC818]|uniref:phage/plasmid primase, P4 family n=1 Tax=Thalassoglobus sp. JC818 TaxID=3232136 RepID=UPI00345A93D9
MEFPVLDPNTEFVESSPEQSCPICSSISGCKFQTTASEVTVFCKNKTAHDVHGAATQVEDVNGTVWFRYVITRSTKINNPFEGKIDLHDYLDLRRSGLSDETIESCQFYTEEHYERLASIINWKSYSKKMGSALVIPFFGMDGELNGFKRIKPLYPKKDRNGRKQKYLSPKGVDTQPYFPPKIIPHLLETTVSLIITEGEKKAAKATQEGFPCIGLPGVDCFRQKGKDKLSPELQRVKWQGREVFICYDSDLSEKEQVAQAEAKLASFLSKVGAKVKVIRLPDGPDGSKQGLDDYLINHGRVEFSKLRDKAEDPLEVDAGELSDGFDAAVTAEEFLATLCLHNGVSYNLRFWRDEFWTWAHGRYTPIPDSDLRCAVRKFIDDQFEKPLLSMATNVIDSLKSKVHIPHRKEQPSWLISGKGQGKGWISFANGIGNIYQMEAKQGESEFKQSDLIPHTPEFFSPIVMPYPYDPEAECPAWFEFLAHNLDGDARRIELLQEWFGYCLIPGNERQKFLILYGEGGTGKSTALAALRGLLGEENVSSVPLEQFGSRFSLIQTVGKLANIAADTGEIDKTAEGYLKSFTSGDKMQFEQKMKPVFSAVPTAKMILATNNLPRFTDRTAGIWRRIGLIPFDTKVDPSRRVVGMDTPKWWLENGELSGIFNWAMQGRMRLEERGEFTTSEKCEDIIEEYRIQSNPAMNFLMEHYAESQNGYVVTSDVYAGYKQWCDDNGYRKLSAGQFGKEVNRTFPTAVKTRKNINGERHNTYEGIYKVKDHAGIKSWS